MGRPVVLVLGGGIGGLVASNVLKQKLNGEAAVTLVDRKRYFQFPPSYPWLMLGMRRPEQVQRELNVLEKKGIEVLNAEVKGIDLQKRVIEADGSQLPFDYLIIALGAEYAAASIPGLAEHAHHIYDLESALKWQHAADQFSHGTLAIGISSLPFKCPAAPYEVALLLDQLYRKRGTRENMQFKFFTPESIPVPSVGPEIGNKVRELLQARGIEYLPQHKLSRVDDGAARFDNGEAVTFDLLFCVPPHRCPGPAVEAGLTDQTGWVPVHPETLETKHPRVYAVGDITALPTPSGYAPLLPKAGVFAHGQAEVVAHNIAVEIKGRGKKKVWDGRGACFLEVGGAKSAFVRGSFLARPRPQIEFHEPSRIWHMQKVLFEKYWMHHWF